MLNERHEKHLLKEILEVLHEQLKVQRECLKVLLEIRHDVHKILVDVTPKQLTTAVAVLFRGVMNMANNVLVFNVGQTSQASIMPFLADGITPSGGVLSNVSYTFTDPSATVVLNPDGVTATCTGVADSGGIALSGFATCTVTDSDGVVSQWTQAFTIQTIAVVPPQQLTQSVAVQFSAPVGGALKAGVTPVGQRSKG